MYYVQALFTLRLTASIYILFVFCLRAHPSISSLLEIQIDCHPGTDHHHLAKEGGGESTLHTGASSPPSPGGRQT